MVWPVRPRDQEQQDGFDAVGAMVRRRRVWLGWSQRYLEMRSGVDQTVISRIENGKQYGIRWSRFATLVGSMGGLDLPDPAAAPRPRPQHRSLWRRPTVIGLTSSAADDARDADDESRPSY
jgi:transcriptional regulator with XRE-family HTH domain